MRRGPWQREDAVDAAPPGKTVGERATLPWSWDKFLPCSLTCVDTRLCPECPRGVHQGAADHLCCAELTKRGSDWPASHGCSPFLLTPRHWWIDQSFLNRVWETALTHTSWPKYILFSLCHMQLFLGTWCDPWHICICEIISHSLNQDFAALRMLGEGFQNYYSSASLLPFFLLNNLH